MTIAFVLILMLTGCERAAVRVPGASFAFPESPAGYAGSRTIPATIVVLMPSDRRGQHQGEKVAGTDWTVAMEDTLASGSAMPVIQSRIAADLKASRLFENVTTEEPKPGDYVLTTNVNAFNAQVVGVVIARVAGIVSLELAIDKDGKGLFQHKAERVVTDADSEYSGSPVTFIEQAMRVTMSDSLREVSRGFLAKLDSASPGWGND
jgi:hypothetical protein